MKRLLGLLILCWSLAAGIATAQEQLTPDRLAEWDQTASRAETVIANAEASTEALEDLRAQLATERERFFEAQNVNDARIQTVREQLSALGPEPAEGETEPDEVAQRRQELQQQLVRLRAPVIEAEEAYIRADGLIGEIDRIVRERQADALFELGPSPLNPTHWPEAAEAVGTFLSGIAAEVRASYASPATNQRFRDSIPIVVFYLVLAGLLLVRGRAWMERIAGLVVTRTSRGRGVWRFIISLGQIILPMIGLIAVAAALDETGLFGTRGTAIVDSLPGIGFFPIMAYWLGGVLFPRREVETNDIPVLNLDPGLGAEIRRYLNILGIFIAGIAFVDVMGQTARFSDAETAVLRFPFLALIALILFRIGQIVLRLAPGGGEGEDNTLKRTLVRAIGRGAMVVAVLAPILAAIGYSAAADAILPPTVVSLALIGLLIVLIRFVHDLYALISGSEAGARDALIPVLIAFLVVLLSLIPFALIWGVRWTDLTELWAQIQEGFAVGDARIRPTDFLWFVVVFAIGYTLTRLLQSALKTTILPRTKLDIGGTNAIVAGTGYVGIFVAALVAISSAGIDLSNLAIVAGALGVGIGFGLQNIVSNFISGIILLIERPIREGDWIKVGDQMGYVRNISVRSTRIETFDRTDVIVPNADLISGTVTNYTHGNNVGRVIVPVGVAYGTDTRKVEAVLREIAEAHPMVLLNPPPAVLMRGFGGDSLDFEIRAILRDVNWVLSVQSDLCHEIAKRFAEEGIEIPFAQRDIWLRNPETLRAGDT
ncbi:DUF3772 domain-containing protein [Aestuariibius sp. 2305UL40-4]|uniref:DUF3772 domain-containing protein n=1 Tax=Aestuariibius violaceus TaxID=3234132 RepID=UPI00345E89DB